MTDLLTIDASELLNDLALAESRILGALLERVGERTVELLQSYTGGTKKDGRRIHPGAWADRTGNLADHYGYQVDHDTGVWRLVIYNSAKHAHLLEALDGYFVVRGIMDKGGPVWDALTQAVRELAPEWRVAA